MVREIRGLVAPAAYAAASTAAVAHAETLDFAGSLRGFEEACILDSPLPAAPDASSGPLRAVP